MVLAFAATASLTYWFKGRSGSRNIRARILPVHASEADTSSGCGFTFKRLSGYAEVAPLFSAESNCESARFAGLRAAISGYIEKATSQGVLMDASVHLQDLHTTEWMVINDDGRYSPRGSMRVVLLIAYLQWDEKEPGVLDRELQIIDGMRVLPALTHAPPSTVRPNVGYPARDLLIRAFKENDMLAASVLVAGIPREFLEGVFQQVGLPATCMDTLVDRLGARQYSLFWKALVHGAALSPRHSEEALDLLTLSENPEGIAAGLPSGVEVATQFGETLRPGEAQFRESGIVYLKGSTYLLTIMAKGPDITKLPSVLKDVSSMTYAEMSAPHGKKVL